MVGILSALILYTVLLIVIAVLGKRATKDLDDYILGGRKLSSFVSAMGVGASDMSGWLLLGLPGAVFLGGLNQAWIAIGLIVGAYLNWTYVAYRLRLFTEKLNASTVSSYISKRLEDNKGSLKALSGVIIFVFFSIYVSASFVSNAKLIIILFPSLPYIWCLLIGAILILFYVLIGGFFAVAWADAFQASLMFFALILVPLVGVAILGSSNVINLAQQYHGTHYFSLWPHASFLAFISLLAWGLGYFGQPHILVRFMAIKTPSAVKKARNLGMGWMIITLVGSIFVGLIGGAFYAHLTHPEQVFLLLTKAHFSSFLVGILYAAVLSAVMSTASAQILVSASVVAHDFYAHFRPNQPNHQYLWVSRIAVVLLAVIAFYIGRSPNSVILNIVSYGWAGLGSAFGPVILLSLFWKGLTRQAAFWGMLVSSIIIIVWHILGQRIGGIFTVYEMIPGFAVNLIVLFVVSYMDKNKITSPKILALFDEVKKK